ncbi:MAG: hypothetical protein JW885_05025, partial [Deltaproteobacteria bacterium]|nr:hypothetical protein [Candidatus Zymogenaceae bacterium]
LGIMHLVEVGGTPGLSEMGWTPGQELEVVSRYQTAKRQLDEIFDHAGITEEAPAIPGTYEVNPLDDIDELEEKIQAYHSQIRSINDEIYTLRDKLNIEEDNLRRLDNLTPVDVDVSHMRDLTMLRMFYGYFPSKHVRLLEEGITAKFTTYIPIQTRGDRELSAFFCLPEDAETLEDELKNMLFEFLPLPQDCAGTPGEARQQIEGRINELKVRIGEGENKLRGFGWTYRNELLRIREHLTTNLDILVSVKSMGLSESTALITGWIPAKSVDDLKRVLAELLGDLFYLEVTPAEEVEGVKTGKVKVPVIMRNPKLLKPFQALVTTYGSPDYTEIEPSSIIGVAFLLMFGVMFGDVGHGFVLAFLGWLLTKKVPAAEEIGGILLRAGVSSIFFGFCFGSIFGYEDVIPALIFHPMHNITTLMAVTVAFGILFLSIGLVINLINSLRSRDMERGIFETHGLAGALFYWAAVAFMIKFIATGNLGVPLWVFLTILGVPLLVIFLREPLYHLFSGKRPLIHDPISYFLGSLVEVLDTCTGYLSNTISFIRVAAFSLAHAALFLGVFQLKAMVPGQAPSFLMELGGNILIVGLEGLVVSIQSVRLIYYEFFSKFYSGNGEAFVPMKIGTSKDTDITR